MGRWVCIPALVAILALISIARDIKRAEVTEKRLAGEFFAAVVSLATTFAMLPAG